VDPGSGPERDDTGLPPVDVEIPDDARELDRDVHAYLREQRAERRHRRSVRVRGALTRDGMLLPLLACCLIFALITGTLLTLFSATSIDQGLPGSAKAGQSAAGTGMQTGAVPTVTTAPAGLGQAPVTIGGIARTVSSLRPAVLLVVPGGCLGPCNGTIAQLAAITTELGARPYLVTTPADVAQSAALAVELGHELLTVTDDSGRILGTDYPHAGLTAILVRPDGSVSYAQQLQDDSNLIAMLRVALV